MSPTIMCGVRPSSSSASAPPSTATITGRMSRMNGRSARRSRWWPTPRTTTSVERSRKSVAKRGSSIRPASSSRSSRMCSIVLWAKRSSASPISRRRASVSAQTRARSSTSPRASSSPPRSTSPPARPSRSPRRRGPHDGSPSETASNSESSGRSTSRMPGLDEQLRPEVGVGAARGGAAVEHRDGAGGDQLLGGDAVDVEMVDQRDVAADEMSDQQLRLPPGPHRAADRRDRPGGLRRRARGRRGRRERGRLAGTRRSAGARAAGHRHSEGNARGRRAHRSAAAQAARRSSRA